jgi:hypothetical protein
VVSTSGILTNHSDRLPKKTKAITNNDNTIKLYESRLF